MEARAATSGHVSATYHRQGQLRQQFEERVLPGAFATGSVRYDVELVRLLSPTIAVTGVASTAVDDDGTATSRGLPTYVWRRDGDEWRIVVGQNTAAAA